MKRNESPQKVIIRRGPLSPNAQSPHDIVHTPLSMPASSASLPANVQPPHSAAPAPLPAPAFSAGSPLIDPSSPPVLVTTIRGRPPMPNSEPLAQNAVAFTLPSLTKLALNDTNPSLEPHKSPRSPR